LPLAAGTACRGNEEHSVAPRSGDARGKAAANASRQTLRVADGRNALQRVVID